MMPNNAPTQSLMTVRKTRGLDFGLLASTILVAMAIFSSNISAEDALWASHVEPLLKEHCAECHNATKAKSGLDLSSLQTILRGGDRGAAVIPGRPNESHLYTFLSSEAD